MSVPKQHLQKARRDLADLISIPSVSTTAQSLDECADVVSNLLSEAGFSTSIHPGQVGPFVVGQIGSGPKTIMIYNHYDVQPEGALELWTSPPFELSERNGKLFGRGVADDKGEFVSRLAGWNMFRESQKSDLPFRLIWIVDGEEEIGSPSLDKFIEENFEATDVDFCWWEFGEVDISGRPIILLGFKGILAGELRMRTAKADLHSSFGAVFENPLWRLISAVSTMKNNEGKMLIKGFYDTVISPDDMAIKTASTPPYTLNSLKDATSAYQTLPHITEDGFYANLNFDPCLNINGMLGGYGGEGSKTVLPAEGVIKFDFRLVPNQKPEEISKLIRTHLDCHGFEDIELIIHDDVVRPVRTSPDHWAVKSAASILEKWFQMPAILQPSSPASGTAHPFVDRLGAAVIGIGLTHHGAMIHSPNENIYIDQLEKMIGFSADFFAEISEVSRTSKL